MIISNREKALLAVTVVVILYAVLGLKLKSGIDSVKEKRQALERAEAKLNMYNSLVAQSGVWSGRYKENADLIPVFANDARLETHWGRKLSQLASTNGLTIVKSQALKENLSGDVFEMPIECKEWEGSLESLVNFLYDVHAEGAMLDVRDLYIRPATGKVGGLRGSFTLYCAYLRDDSSAEKKNGE